MGELESERKEEGSENGELRLLGTPGREGGHYPSIVKTGNTGRAGGWVAGSRCDTLERLS